MSKRKIATVLFYLAPVALIALVWYPVLVRHLFLLPEVSDEVISFLRNEPSNYTLSKLSQLTLSDPFLGQYPPESPEGQLIKEGLFELESALEKYERSGDEKLFEYVRHSILEYSKEANRPKLDLGFKWNEHAIAQRVFVISRFWSVYRSHPSFNIDDAREILRHQLTNAKFLVSPRHFIFRTNHGMMQSVALLHLAASFPAFADRNTWINVALDRLNNQMVYFVSPDGWVLEHSAGYQILGYHLIDTLFGDLAALRIPIPTEWSQKRDNALRVLSSLVRPDRSLPNFGDTQFESSDSHNRIDDCVENRFNVDYWQFEGYIIAWHQTTIAGSVHCSQMIVVWANFVGGTHKHADELSIHYWLDGTDWFKSVGYWPYSSASRAEFVNWTGSNAPHFVGEVASGYDDVKVHSFCRGRQFWSVDLERFNELSRSSIRRQVIGFGVMGGLVLDYSQSEVGEYESVWRSTLEVEDIVLEPDGSMSFTGMPDELRFYVAGQDINRHILDPSTGSSIDKVPASIAATASSGRIYEVPTMVIRSRVGKPVVVAWGGQAGSVETIPRLLTSFISPSEWVVESADKSTRVERHAGVLLFTSKAGLDEARCESGKSDSLRETSQRLDNKFLEMSFRYPVFKLWFEYRVKLTHAILATILLQAASLGAVIRRRKERQDQFKAVVIFGWFALGIYIQYGYFAS